MTFIVEDGTIVSGANSYITVDFFRSYMDDRGLSTTFSDTQIERAAVKATDYVEMLHSGEFVGSRVDSTQTLSWPRAYAYNRYGILIEDTEIPLNLQKAVAEYALRAMSGALAPDPTVDDSGKAVIRRRARVGPIEEEFEYEGGGAVSQIIRSYPAADKLLWPIIHPSGGRVIRG